jgi:hypothetical protein
VLLAAIITKNGSFYPTKEALLRHAVTHVQLLQGAKDNLAGEDEEKDTLQLDSLDLLRSVHLSFHQCCQEVIKPLDKVTCVAGNKCRHCLPNSRAVVCK